MVSVPTAVSLALDHVVIAVKDGLDSAAEIYRRLGFSLTERGHHSRGSSNHLAIFGETYLELLGYEPEKAHLCEALRTSPTGLNGLVFKPPQVDDFPAVIRSNGAQIDPPSSFHRPVRFAGGSGDARFTTATVRDSRIERGRIFFCRHFTPELVWRDEWRDHPNGATDVGEFVFTARAPEKTAGIFTDLFGAAAVYPVEGGFAVPAGRAQVLVLAPSAVAARFGAAAPPLPDDGQSGMAALGVRVRRLDQARRALAAGDLPFEALGDRLVVPATAAFGVAVAFFA